jgi:formylglycine-generating enzyme required for sulfatase activity
METPRRLKIFLCHASGDKPAVRDLYRRLCAAGFDPWLNEEKLLPGQDWQLEIPQAVRSSDAVIVCLSSRAVTKRGYVQKEIRYALDVADEQPEGAIFLIPLRLERCDVPHRLRRWQWVDLFHEKGYERLLRALRARAESLGLPIHPFEPEMVLIPAGEFLMGSDPRKDKDASDDEQPQHTLYLPDYYIARTPVTNAQYAAFLQAAFYRSPRHWKGGPPPAGKEEHPVAYVSWHDVVAYCRWLSETTGKPYRLPSEAEWEKGARGCDGRIYPWGDEWDVERCSSKEGGKGDTTPVGTYPQGASPYGLLDMAGNVWEWTRSLYRDYPYDPADGRENSKAGVGRVVRGGSFRFDRRGVRCAVRGRFSLYAGQYAGFRVCVEAQQD